MIFAKYMRLMVSALLTAVVFGALSLWDHADYTVPGTILGLLIYAIWQHAAERKQL